MFSRTFAANRDRQKRADAMAVRLQDVVSTIAADYPAAASEVADASRLLGQLAERLPVGDVA